MVENQPAEFICQFSRPVKAQWKKDGQPLRPDGRRVVVEQDWNVARLYFSRVSAEDRGTYSCEAEGTSVVASLHVEGELPSTWKEHQPLESPLLLIAHSYTANKIVPYLKHCSFSCYVFLFLLHMSATAKPITIVQGLENMETFNGGEALFECALSRPESKNCRWLLDGKPVKESPNAEIVTFESGRRHLLLLKELSLKDSCTVTFQADTASTSAKLSVKGDPKQFNEPQICKLNCITVMKCK